FFRVNLQPGDVFATSGSGGVKIAEIIAPDDSLLVGTFIDEGFDSYPLASPLPRAGAGNVASVINRAGSYAVGISGRGGYQLDLRVFRPELEQQPELNHQIVFLDFDGAFATTTDFPDGVSLAPLVDALPDMLLTAADLNPLIDRIIDVVRENLANDIRALGLNGNFAASGIPGRFDIEILN